MGDSGLPTCRGEEPLQNVVRHFADCIESGTTPLTDGDAGLRVVRILEAAQRSIEARADASLCEDRWLKPSPGTMSSRCSFSRHSSRSRQRVRPRQLSSCTARKSAS